MISLLKIVDLPWEKARGYLRTDLQTIESSMNQRWAATFGDKNVLNVASIATGAIDLTTKVTGILPIASGGTGSATVAAKTVFGNPTAGVAAPLFTGNPSVASLTTSALAAVTTAAESWVGPSSTTGIYFKSGNVGIGTITPTFTLDVEAVAAILNLQSTTGTNAAYHKLTNTGGTLYFGQESSTGGTIITGSTAYAGIFGTSGARVLQLATNNAVAITIDTTGKVGLIGVTAPAAYLHIKGINIANRGQLTIEGSDFAQLTFYKDATTKSAAMYSTQSTGQFNFLNAVSNANTYFNLTGTTGLFSFQGTGELRISANGLVLMYNNITTAGLGHPTIYGTPDNRTGLTVADGAPITIYTTIASNNIFRVSADIFATAAVTGTATYTIAWTENGTAQTMAVTATAINVLGTASNLIRPDTGTTITAQLTGVFTGTFTVAGFTEQLA